MNKPSNIRKHIEDVVIAALNHHSAIEVTKNTTDLTIESLWIDSLDQVHVILEIEENLPISIDDEALAVNDDNEIKTVADFINHIEGLYNEQN